jgi:hypothetical protein
MPKVLLRSDWKSRLKPYKVPRCPTARSTRTGSKTQRAVVRMGRTATFRNGFVAALPRHCVLVPKYVRDDRGYGIYREFLWMSILEEEG